MNIRDYGLKDSIIEKMDKDKIIARINRNNNKK